MVKPSLPRTLSISIGFLLALSAVQAAENTVDLENEESRISYSLGVNIGQSLVAQGLMESVDLELFLAGMTDVVNDDVKLEREEVAAALEAFQQQMIAEQQAAIVAAKAVGEDFLATNAVKEGVVTTASGLQYLKMNAVAGDAPMPQPSDSVKVHYHGTMIDGSVFDSSVDRGQPATFGVTQVIQGWVEALQLMKVGEKWRLFIAPALAYGESGSGSIPPNSTLIFEVELLEIVE